MFKVRVIVFVVMGLISLVVQGQNASIQGTVRAVSGEVLPFANVYIEQLELGATTNEEGMFSLKNIPPGTHSLSISFIGYQTLKKELTLTAGQKVETEFNLRKDALNLESVVISGTRYEQDRQNNPVVVGVIDKKLFNATQSIAVSEGLNYQAGVRVETNCQNCGFTQVRLNGLEGAYTQILINSRPIFSALNSVYGLDQIPTNIVDRVEVVRSGGSALYGSNAIAGTINIITKDPVENTWSIGSNTALIDGDALDQTFNLNTSLVSEDLSSGVTFYGMRRQRDSYDANGDGFTELVNLENTVIGAKAFVKPTERSKISIDFSGLEEYRRGGDRLDLAPHFTDITEELDHNTFFGGFNYDQWSKSEQNKFSFYGSAQRTQRDSYYGGLGGGRTQEDSTLALNAYGKTEDISAVLGTQFNRYFKDESVLTLGVENQLYDTKDEIAGYERWVDQNVNTLGFFAQYEWKVNERWTTLLGGRYDLSQVNGNYAVGGINRSVDVNVGVFSPRLTLLYKVNEFLRFRGGYARGFRAPQAFNEDLHISSAGGDQVFGILGENLEKETSDAYTASFNFTKNKGNAQYNALIEGFYTRLSNPFTQVGRGNIGDIILEEVINGEGATVSGLNLEAGYSPNNNFAFQLGGTLQQTAYDTTQVLYEPASVGEVIVATDQFVRTPNLYGYLSTEYYLNEDIKFDFTGSYTGSMIVPRVVNENGVLDLIDSEAFFDANIKASYQISLQKDVDLELSAGVRNLLNSFQKEFDSGPERDSDFIFGPAAPRSIFFSVKIGNLK